MGCVPACGGNDDGRNVSVFTMQPASPGSVLGKERYIKQLKSALKS